jgi:hypothetical protein
MPVHPEHKRTARKLLIGRSRDSSSHDPLRLAEVAPFDAVNR